MYLPEIEAELMVVVHSVGLAYIHPTIIEVQ